MQSVYIIIYMAEICMHVSKEATLRIESVMPNI